MPRTSEPALMLYVVAGSHPCLAVEGALHYKQLAYQRVERYFGLAPAQQRLAFGGRTVPAMRIGRQHVLGSRLIMRTLDGLQPERPLIPIDPKRRDAVNDADRWGDEIFQEETRWITLRAVAGHPDAFPSYLTGARMPAPPRFLLAPMARGYFAIGARALGHHDRLHTYLTTLPDRLDHIDHLIADGTLGGDQPTVADFQIGASVRLLSTLEDLDALLSNRPCRTHAHRLFPNYPGHTPAGGLPSTP